MSSPPDVSGPVSSAASPLAADRLAGARAIAEFIGVPVRRVNYMLAQGFLPVGRLGRTFIGSKRTLTSFFDDVSAGKK